MTNQMSRSDEYRELLEGYALGALDREEAAAVAAHLPECAECRKALEEARWTVAQLAYLAPPAEPSDMLRGRLVGTVRAEARAGARPAKPGMPLWVLAGVAAMLLFTLYTAWDAREVQKQLAGANQHAARVLEDNRRLLAELELARREAIEADPRSVRFVSAEKQAAPMVALWHAKLGILLTGQNVPDPAGNRTYQLWLIPKAGGKPVPCHTLRPDRDGTVRVLVTQPPELLANTKALAITIEPEGGSPAPTSSPVWVGGIA